MSCVLERGPNPGCHTQNHMVHLFLTEDVVGFCISKSSSHPDINTLTFGRRKGKHGIHALSGKGVSCSQSKRVYIGQGIARVTRTTLEESVLYGYSHPGGIFNTREHLSLSFTIGIYIAPLCGA